MFTFDRQLLLDQCSMYDVGGWDAPLSNLIVYMYVYHELNRRSPQHNALSWAAL